MIDANDMFRTIAILPPFIIARFSIREVSLHPSIFLDVEQAGEVSGVGVSVCCREDTSAPQLQCLVVLEIVLVLRIQYTGRECLT